MRSNLFSPAASMILLQLVTTTLPSFAGEPVGGYNVNFETMACDAIPNGASLLGVFNDLEKKFGECQSKELKPGIYKYACAGDNNFLMTKTKESCEAALKIRRDAQQKHAR